RLADPPHRIGDEFDVLVGVELLRGVDESDVAFVDQVEEEDMRVAIALGVRDDEPEIRLDQLLQGTLVVFLHTPAELTLAFGSETRDLRDLMEIMVEQIVRVVACFVPGHALGTGILTRLRVASCALRVGNTSQLATGNSQRFAPSA